jgi:integrase
VNAELDTTTDRTDLVQRWAQRHGVAHANRLAEAEDFADAVAEAIVPPNTLDTYDKGWRVWQRFCATQGFPETEGTRGALVAYVAWLLREGRTAPGPDGTLGYAPSSAGSHLSAAVVGLRKRGHHVSRDDVAEARKALEGMTVKLLQAGERRGRGKAPAADPDGLRSIAAACDDTLTGLRDLSLVLLSFHVAGRASEPAGLLLGDVTEYPQGLKVSIVTGKTKHSVRAPVIPYAQDPAVCPVRAWRRWREALVAQGGSAHNDPSDPAFHAIDRWGNVGGAMTPDSVTRAIARISQRSGVPIRWTGHSLRSGLATAARRAGKDSVVIQRQGGWASGSRSLDGYMRIADEWADNASSGIM